MVCSVKYRERENSRSSSSSAGTMRARRVGRLCAIALGITCDEEDPSMERWSDVVLVTASGGSASSG
jgi:hypothetical protein